MRLLAPFLLLSLALSGECAVTANFISDPRSMFPKVMRTKNAFHFLHFFMGTFKQMFRSKMEIIDHFNYYDDHVKGFMCYTDKALDYAQLKAYFERYAATHSNPKISIAFAVITEDGLNMTVDFDVRTSTWFGLEDQFLLVINAYNDTTVGWGVRSLSMEFDC
ncbi:unnamed protein product [Caenorhabditis sp. 36 PRJEB53466]|nr:unnamed protein product [Caenorhabditis sp. 36 PRJEB53466]